MFMLVVYNLIDKFFVVSLFLRFPSMKNSVLLYFSGENTIFYIFCDTIDSN